MPDYCFSRSITPMTTNQPLVDMKNFTLLILLFLVSNVAYSDGWIGSGKLLKIHLKPAENKVLVIHEKMIDTACGDTPSHYLLDLSDNYGKEMYTTLLSAFTRKAETNMLVRCQQEQAPKIAEIILQ